MKKPVILPYKLGSQSAKSLSTKLAETLKRKVFRVDNQSRTYRVKPNRLYINWGSSNAPRFNATPVLNSGAAVAVASNKLSTFNRFAERNVACPEFTTDPAIARQWASERTIFARTALNGHSGRGIVECFGSSFIDAPLFTKYIPKQDEYRVHVFQGRVIDVQQKKKRRDIPNEQINYKVRSYQNGWVFCRENIQKPEGLDALAIQAVTALGLDFGAVDIIYNAKRNQCYALEVNTAPGLSGQTTTNYTNAVLQALRT